jgi:integrase
MALARMGYRQKGNNRQTGHGFRRIASTVLHESGKFNSAAIEAQLAHADKDKIRATYNKAIYLPERRKMMQWWSDYVMKQGK